MPNLELEYMAASEAKKVLDSPAIQDFLESEEHRLFETIISQPIRWSKDVEEAYRTVHFAMAQLKRFKRSLEASIAAYEKAVYQAGEDERLSNVEDGV